MSYGNNSFGDKYIVPVSRAAALAVVSMTTVLLYSIIFM